METLSSVAPQTIDDTGIPKALLEELAIKILFSGGEMSLVDLSEKMCLSMPIIEEIFQFLRREQLCEVKGMARGTHRIAASGHGKARALELLSSNHYAGPAPVSIADYNLQVQAQSVQQTPIQPTDLDRAFQSLVLDDDILTRLGTAVTSGTSIFLYGPSGTGKTTIAGKIPAIYHDSVLVPYAVEVDNQIITLFDPGVHHRVEGTAPEDSDKRWVLCDRPRVVTGGELSAEMLDLQYNAVSRFYTAPVQMKANNGVLILDDFGRQRMRPDELLNRWMTPLDRRIDFLTLPGGKKFEAIFDVVVVFSTNLEPLDLADEAFLRRIPNKIKIGYATPEQFVEIFRRECAARSLSCEADVPEYLVKYVTAEMKQPLSQCLARDLINQIFWAAAYMGVEPRLNREAINQAGRNYFLKT
jgi:hypothetical protein